MAENSVFAILLRSSWWISVVVGAIIVLLCLALLPKDIRFVGAAGSLPFFVIGAMAAKRQWKAPSSAATEALLAHAASLPARDLQAWRCHPDERAQIQTGVLRALQKQYAEQR